MEPLLRRERRPQYRLYRLYRLEMYSGISVVLWKYTDIVKVIRNYDWTLGLCRKILKSSKYIYLKLDLLYHFQQIPKIWESNCGILWCSAWLSHQLWSYAFSEWRHPSSFVFALVQYLPCAASTYKISSSAANIWTHSTMEGFFSFHFLLLPPWLRHVSGNFSHQDRKFHNGCLSAGKPRLNFCYSFCESWCYMLKQ